MTKREIPLSAAPAAEGVLGPLERYATRLMIHANSRSSAFLLLLLSVSMSGFRDALGAQEPITAGRPISGRLSASDPRLSDGSHYDLYEYRGRPGERIQITMRSREFDTYLAGGALERGALAVEETDDDGAGGTDSRLTVRLGPSGVYGIRANSLAPNMTGEYTLTVEILEAGQAADGPLAISAGEVVRGQLDSGDPVLGDGSHYELYVYRGTPGEEISVVMRSSDFDAYLAGGTLRGSEFIAEDSNDDGAGGTDALLTATVPASGVYAIRANSLSSGQTGAFTLTVQASSGPTTGPTASTRTLRVGETVIARLSASTPQLPDGSHYDTYYLDARAGDRFIVTMASNDFDTYLRWGREQGGSFELLDTDDDGGGGTHSRLEVTADAAGRYVIQANSFASGATGAYTLTVADGSTRTSGLPSLTLGQTVSARLDASDPVLPDNSHYELYLYQGRPQEQVLVTMRSSDFDAYLAVGRMVGGTFESTETNDDGAGGTDAEILATLDRDGVLVVRANSLLGGQTGAFTLSVRPASGGAPSPAPSPPAARTLAAGQTVSGTLRAGDPMMADSSFYHDYVYGGAPGERVRISLVSDDFDALLQWGRLDGDRFRVEVSDDDGGGGTNSRLETTVSGSGPYVVRVNTFSAGETGSYRLTVERIATPSLPPPAPAPGSTSASSGKWRYDYIEAADPALRPIGQRVKQWQVLEQLTADLARRYALPRDIEVRFDQCGFVNAFYRPSTTDITFCYELVAFLADLYVPDDGRWTQEAQDQVSGAVSFILWHEVGHALVDILDLPITGREEDAADQLSVVSLMESGEKGALAAYAGVLALQPEEEQFGRTDFADEHSLGPVRLYNVLCWIFGSDPEKYMRIVADGRLPEERAVRCPGEWDRMSKAWQRLLAPHSTG